MVIEQIFWTVIHVDSFCVCWKRTFAQEHGASAQEHGASAEFLGLVHGVKELSILAIIALFS